LGSDIALGRSHAPADETFPPSAGVPVTTTGVVVAVDPSTLAGSGLASFIGKLAFQ